MPSQGELTADAAFFVPAVGVTGALAEALVYLDPPGFDRMCRAKRSADVVRPNVGCKPVMAIVRHADRFHLVGPRDSDKDGAEYFFARQAPVVCIIRKKMVGISIIAFAAAGPSWAEDRRLETCVVPVELPPRRSHTRL